MYSPADTCLNCGNWQEPGLERCNECREEGQLRTRERRIHGWVGIQRYLDKSEFGVDFLRNGRKILINDKSIFDWSDINDPTSPPMPEYPAELNQGGRIIGEIHLDHVPVDYKKDSFERSDRQWRQAVNFLRGAGPLLPEAAKRAGYPRNDSPIGVLFRGYRRNDAGRRCLIPGDGIKPLHAKAVEWAERFHRGDARYQSDDEWWNAVVDHEERKTQAATGKIDDIDSIDVDENTLINALGGDSSDNEKELQKSNLLGPANISPTAPPQETEQERLVRYRADGRALSGLSGDLGHPDVGYLKIETFVLSSSSVLDHNEKPTSVWIAPGSGGNATAFVAENHHLFTRFGWSYEDAVVVELAAVLKARIESRLSVTEIASLIKTSSLRDSAIDRATIANRSTDLLNEIKRLMASLVESEPERAFQWLNSDEAATVENNMIADGTRGSAEIGSDSRFVLYAPALYLVRLLEEWPDAFMDGAVFRSPYVSLSSHAARRHSLTRITSLLADVASASYQTDPGSQRLQRTRLSIALLTDELAPDDPVVDA